MLDGGALEEHDLGTGIIARRPCTTCAQHRGQVVVHRHVLDFPVFPPARADLALLEVDVTHLKLDRVAYPETVAEDWLHDRLLLEQSVWES